MSTGDVPQKSGVRRIAAIVLIAGAVASLAWFASRPSAADLWRAAQAEAKAEHWDAAWKFAEQAIQIAPPDLFQITEAGTYAIKSSRLDRAEEIFSRINDTTVGAAEAHRRSGNAWLPAGRVSLAEAEFQRALAIAPQNHEARAALCELLRLSGRYHKLIPHLPMLIAANRCPSALLFAVAWPDKAWLDDEDRTKIKNYLQDDPQAASLGFTVVPLAEMTPESRRNAIQSAKELAKRDTAATEAFAQWGHLLAESGAWNELAEWNATLSSTALDDPRVWWVRGNWLLHHNRIEPAIRCFWETVERSPFHAGATHQLVQLLLRKNDVEAAEAYLQQSQRLAELRQQVVFGKGAGGFPDADTLRRIVDGLGQLGRDWEALGWCQLTAARHPELAWPKKRIPELSDQLTPESPWVTEAHRVSRRIRLDQYPLSEWPTTQEKSPSETVHSSDITFQNVARERGLNFQFSNGSSVEHPKGYMYEISAGGVGILDYDLDAWPDIYLSEGGPSLDQPRDPTKRDRFFRNVFGTQVDDVTTLCGIDDAEYGQGVTVGDINADGFPDVFICNIGRNQLWLNHGDGTFNNVTSTAGIDSSGWTMSAAIADLNRDGLADIYEVHYLDKESLTRTCRRDDAIIQCRPSIFTGERDRLWINQGDGRFQDASDDLETHGSNGKGMGVVVSDLLGQGRLALYIANDSEPNTCFVNDGAHPQWNDVAVPHGIALGLDGKPLASMGIAADDVDHDGRLDLSVTNFLSEGSNLYMQDDAGNFAEQSRTVGLYEQSLPVMGWGTQFIDADLDGWPDLIVANGHLEDYRRWNVTSFMPTQFFRNQQGRRFDLLSAKTIGSYFAETHLGRTVARFDGNRDGREDVLITHVDAPIAWLVNTSRNPAHFLSVRLVGTQSERDAIGTHLLATTAGKRRYKQLSAGDGFQASNQRQVVFGLGEATVVDELQITWPSGVQQRFTSIPADQEILLREGSADWINLTSSTAQPASERPR